MKSKKSVMHSPLKCRVFGEPGVSIGMERVVVCGRFIIIVFDGVLEGFGCIITIGNGKGTRGALKNCCIGAIGFGVGVGDEIVYLTFGAGVGIVRTHRT